MAATAAVAAVSVGSVAMISNRSTADIVCAAAAATSNFRATDTVFRVLSRDPSRLCLAEESTNLVSRPALLASMRSTFDYLCPHYAVVLGPRGSGKSTAVMQAVDGAKGFRIQLSGAAVNDVALKKALWARLGIANPGIGAEIGQVLREPRIQDLLRNKDGRLPFLIVEIEPKSDVVQDIRSVGQFVKFLSADERCVRGIIVLG